MDKIWYRKSFEVIGRCDWDGKKRMTTQNRQKSNAKQKTVSAWSSLHMHTFVQLYCQEHSCFLVIFILTVDLYQRAFPIICTLKTIETIIYSIMIASPRMNTGVKGC